MTVVGKATGRVTWTLHPNGGGDEAMGDLMYSLAWIAVVSVPILTIALGVRSWLIRSIPGEADGVGLRGAQHHVHTGSRKKGRRLGCRAVRLGLFAFVGIPVMLPFICEVCGGHWPLSWWWFPAMLVEGCLLFLLWRLEDRGQQRER